MWIYELCELEGLNRAETAKTKAFLSRNTDRGRPAYARFKENWRRQCIFVGTTNDTKYLKDDTGNRRFWPVKTREIDLEGLKRDRDQLWAEAAYWEAKGESLILPEELWATAAKEQESRMQEDPWFDVLSGVVGVRVGDFKRVSTRGLAESHLQFLPHQLQPYHTVRIGKVMRKLGWDGPKKIRLKKGEVARGYERKVDDKDVDE